MAGFRMRINFASARMVVPRQGRLSPFDVLQGVFGEAHSGRGTPTETFVVCGLCIMHGHYVWYDHYFA